MKHTLYLVLLLFAVDASAKTAPKKKTVQPKIQRIDYIDYIMILENEFRDGIEPNTDDETRYEREHLRRPKHALPTLFDYPGLRHYREIA